MTTNLHVCAICCLPEIVYDIISGQNVKTIEGYLAVNFEVVGYNSFRDIRKKYFVTAAKADIIDDGIKRKRIRVSPNYHKILR